MSTDTADLGSKIGLLSYLLMSNERVVTTPGTAGTKQFQMFDELFLSPTAEKSLIFTNFDSAYSFGKDLATSFGFNIRVKTSSTNVGHGVTYKYTVCNREGFAASISRKQGKRRRAKESNRCGCPWICKLVGVSAEKISSTVAGTENTSLLRDHEGIVIWFWDRSIKSGPHNHDLDAIDRTENYCIPNSLSSPDQLRLPPFSFTTNVPRDQSPSPSPIGSTSSYVASTFNVNHSDQAFAKKSNFELSHSQAHTNLREMPRESRQIVTHEQNTNSFQLYAERAPLMSMNSLPVTYDTETYSSTSKPYLILLEPKACIQTVVDRHLHVESQVSPVFMTVQNPNVSILQSLL